MSKWVDLWASDPDMKDDRCCKRLDNAEAAIQRVRDLAERLKEQGQRGYDAHQRVGDFNNAYGWLAISGVAKDILRALDGEQA